MDGYTFTLSQCPDPSLLIPVPIVKSQLDTFFQTLDGSADGDPNYFVVAITPATGQSIQTLQAARAADNAVPGNSIDIEANRGDRYIELTTLVGGGSFVGDLADPDFSGILGSIGQTLVASKSTFTLALPATGQAEAIVTVVHVDGTTTIVSPSQYTLVGTVLTLTDVDLVLSLSATDTIQISYQPAAAY